MRADALKLAGDLLGELAGRRQDEGLNLLGARLQKLHGRDGESGRLAGTGLGLDDEIDPREHERHTGCLHRGGVDVADVGERAQDALAQGQVAESHDARCVFKRGDLAAFPIGSLNVGEGIRNLIRVHCISLRVIRAL